MEKNEEQVVATKEDLKKQIAKLKREIKSLEQKRMRSQASLMLTLVDGAPFNEREVEFFKTLTSMINLNREKLQMLKEALRNAE